MFHKILVAMDSSEIGKRVFNEALSLAQVFRASLMILHVLSPDEENSPAVPGMPGLDYYPWQRDDFKLSDREEWDAFERENLELLGLRTEEARSAGVNAECTQSIGLPGESICELAQSWGAELIVTGHRGRKGISELVLGSVSNYVIHHAPCSVLVVHSPANVSAGVP